ncbi:MAG: hypothetical protein NZ703_03965 [Gemmataceae bacterium]|nr:hypothetical protein [Gemmataceae bacterium]
MSTKSQSEQMQWAVIVEPPEAQTAKAVKISFMDESGARLRRFPLRQEGELWICPEIVLEPLAPQVVIKQVEVTVQGTPENLVKRLQAAYHLWRLNTPVHLTQARSWAASRVWANIPLSADLAAELKVRVYYWPQALLEGQREQIYFVEETCELYAGSVPDVCSLTVHTQELVVLIGKVSMQVIEVRSTNRPVRTAPRLRLRYPETVVSPQDPVLPQLTNVVEELREKLQRCLSESVQQSVVSATVVRYSWAIDLRLSDLVKKVIGEVDGGLKIPVVTELAGAKPQQWLLHLEAPNKVFPGLVAMDFGTSNSTVAVYDTWKYIPTQGFSQEQEEYLCDRLEEWFSQGVSEALGRASQELQPEWQRWQQLIVQRLGLHDTRQVCAWLRQPQDPPALHQLLYQMELSLPLQSERLRRAVTGALYKMYRAALRIPPLQRFNLFAMNINLDTREQLVPSDIEVCDVQVSANNPQDRWPVIRLGRQAHKNKLAAIDRADAQTVVSLLQRFPPSPKRFFGTDHGGFRIQLDGNRQYQISVDELMRAGWQKLLELCDAARRDDKRFSEGPIRRVIVTYPTVAPPAVRQNIHKLVQNLGIADIRTDYDEAIAAAIFYFFREYTSMPELGMERFKARSRLRGEGSWSQNALVLDIGGGTTDIALIRLTLTEERVFAAGESRGAGGRYYKITPRLLGATGHMQLGGELMTLRLFYLLKAMIADQLLSLAQQDKVGSAKLKEILQTQLPEEARKGGKYESGWLQKVVERENPDVRSQLWREATQLMDQVFPTRWREAGSAEEQSLRLHCFYNLWDLAEDIKKQLGGRAKSEDSLQQVYIADGDRKGRLLARLASRWGAKDIGNLVKIQVNREQVEKCIRPVVEEAVKIAHAVVQTLPEGEQLDWLILSGQSCHLRLVDQVIRQVFSQSDKFVWNPERVTFLPEYAKLSTVLGACYAELLRRSRFAPEDSKDLLRRGVNFIYFDINNLFCYLPCTFYIRLPDGSKHLIFQRGCELLEIYGDDLPADQQRSCARSKWEGAALTVDFYREDYATTQQLPWGSFHAQELANQLGSSDQQWQEQIRYQYEVDHRLNIQVLMYRRDGANTGPHYRLRGDEPQLALRGSQETIMARLKGFLGRGTASGAPASVSATAAPTLALFSGQGELQWDIGVGTLQQPTVTLFEAGQRLDVVFHTVGRSEGLVRGVLSIKYVEHFPQEDNQLSVWVRQREAGGQGSWIRAGLLERAGSKWALRRRYRMSLDEKGVLRLHNGEPHYYETSEPKEMWEHPGYVLRLPMELNKREQTEDRDPFSGWH